MIDITGIDKVKVLKALHDFSNESIVADCSRPLEDFQEIVKSYGEVYFETLFGRVMQVYVFNDELDTLAYDIYNGKGTAQRAIDSIK